MAQQQTYYPHDVRALVAPTAIMGMPQLPIELLTAAMEYMPRNTLRPASSVSRAFHAAARLAGLELPRTIELSRPSRSYQTQLATFADIVDHLSAQERPANLGLRFYCICSEGEPVQPGFISALSLISKSLPMLVRLNVWVSDRFCSSLYAALAFPAVRLRTLLFSVHNIEEQERVVVSVPPALFGGIAPALRAVSLYQDAADLVRGNIPAFARVVHVDVSCDAANIAFGPSFPAVRTINMCLFSALSVDVEHKARFDLSGLRLKQLLIDDYTANGALQSVRRKEDCRAEILDIVYRMWRSGLDHHEAFWPEGRPYLDAHVRRHANTWRLFGRITARGRDWTMRFHNGGLWDQDVGIMHLERLPPLQTQLVSLTLDECFLAQLVIMPLTLNALREIFVDFTTPYAPDSFARLPTSTAAAASLPEVFEDIDSLPARAYLFCCPAVEQIVLFARDAERVVVRHDKVVCIARALGQLQRPVGTRAALVLAGVALDVPAAHGRISSEQCYSNIHEFDSAAGGLIPSYCDFQICLP